MTDQIVRTAPPVEPLRILAPAPTAPITARRIHQVIGAAFAVIVVGALWTLVADMQLGLGDTLTGRASRRMFSLRKEGGFPAALSFLLLLGAAGSLWFATWASDEGSALARYRPRWRLLALVLVTAGFDEAFAFHERLNVPVREALGVSGVFMFAWIIPYSIGALALAVAMIAPLRALPRRALLFMLAGGFCYVTGAVGMEMLGGQLKSAGVPRYVYEAEVFVEEVLEMAGVWLFIAGALALARGRDLRLAVR